MSVYVGMSVDLVIGMKVKHFECRDWDDFFNNWVKWGDINLVGGCPDVFNRLGRMEVKSQKYIAAIKAEV